MAQVIVSSFILNTTDRIASKYAEGVCPPLCGDVALSGSASTSAVVSEYGVRYALSAYLNNIDATNLGDGSQIYRDSKFNSSLNQLQFNLRSLKFRNPRFTVDYNPSGQIDIEYDGSNYITDLVASDQYVQGGSYVNQITNTLSLSTSGSWTGSNYITLCANMQNDILANNPVYSGVISNYNTDIAIAKIAIRTPLDNAFIYSGNSGCIITIGDDSNHERLGHFHTQTSADILASSTEWTRIMYNSNTMYDQFEYITSATNIKTYTSGVISGSVQGSFDLYVYYDKV